MKNKQQIGKRVFGRCMLLLLLINGYSVTAQQFIRYLDHPFLTQKQQHHANVHISDKTTAGYWYIEADASLIKKKNTSFALTLPNQSTLMIDQMTYSQSFASMVSGSGKFEPNGDFIVTEHNGMITSRIGNNQFSYMIYPLSGDKHILIQLNINAFPQDESDEGYQHMLKEGMKNKEDERRRIDPETGEEVIDGSPEAAGNCKVRCLVAYTDDVGVALADPLAFAESCIQANNTSFTNSAINFQVELACAFQTTYAESGNSGTDKTRFRNNGDGFMDDVFTWRSTYDADLCHLLVNSLSNGCGEAWSVSVSVYADAFCVTDRTCAVGNLTFPHEYGHLYGCRHDVFVDNTNTPYAYGHGKTVNGNYRTVMAYSDACASGCTRVAYFSNPAITFNGVSTGTSGTADNESASEASRVAISGLEVSVTNKAFPSWTHNDGEFGDVLGINTVTNNTTYVMNSGSEVVWRAGDSHTLKPGFWAKSGSKFVTVFDFCNVLTAAGSSASKINLSAEAISTVRVQPNPFSSRFDAFVEMKEKGSMKLELFDATGKVILILAEQNDVEEGKYQYSIDMSDKAEGMYFILARMGTETKTLKLIKTE
ncbi:MAG: T9SS type A sorting domain-containing protein [Bacteroidetes bacterium]|nr:T9SS type A sorting domain-containing protein [Bacteroidota bacterium]